MPWVKRYRDPKKYLGMVAVVLLVVGLVGVAFLAVVDATMVVQDLRNREIDSRMQEWRNRELQRRQFKKWGNEVSPDSSNGSGDTLTLPRDWRPNGDDYDYRRDF